MFFMFVSPSARGSTSPTTMTSYLASSACVGGNRASVIRSVWKNVWSASCRTTFSSIDLFFFASAASRSRKNLQNLRTHVTGLPLHIEDADQLRLEDVDRPLEPEIAARRRLLLVLRLRRLHLDDERLAADFLRLVREPELDRLAGRVDLHVRSIELLLLAVAFLHLEHDGDVEVLVAAWPVSRASKMMRSPT